MTKQNLIMGVLTGLLGLFGCNNKTADKTSKVDTSKVVTMDPNDFLFTTSTLNSALPDFKVKTDTCAFFHEDEWRQVEFISQKQKSTIDKEFVKIQDIYDNHSHDGGTYTAFKKVAVRDLITEPLSVDFSLLKSYLTDKEIKIQGLGLENNEGQVVGGFFFAINGVNYYGLLDNKTVKTFCIYSADSDKELKEATTNLSKLLAAEKLYLVDWRARKLYDETTIKTLTR
jgi:hypothetical protein